MAEKLGFYELLQPYIAFGLIKQNATGKNIGDLHKAGAQLQSSFPGAASALSDIVTGILDYLSVDLNKLHTAIDESNIVFSGTAKFGGEDRANPQLPDSPSVISQNGHELSWQDDLLTFRLTVPRRSPRIQIDTTGLSGVDLTDLQQLNDLLDEFADDGTPAVSDAPGNDFRLELLIRTVKIKLPSKDFIPAKVGADGWLEPDPDFKEVVFEFPRLAFVLEQKDDAGNLDLSLKSWDSPGFDDPGDPDTARLFTLTPPFFLHSSRRVGFGIERIVADFSDNITPPEILEQFGTGDDFNGLWIPLIRLFIAPGRTTGLAFSARGKDLLFDQDKGFSGELGLDILNRGGKLEVEPVFYAKNAKTPLEFSRGNIERGNDGTTTVSEGEVTIPGEGELHLSIRGSISPYTVSVKLDGSTLTPDTSAGINRPFWNLSVDDSGLLAIHVSDAGNLNRWDETVRVKSVAPPGPPPPPSKKFIVHFTEGSGDPEVHIECLNDLEEELFAVLKLSPDQTDARLRTLQNQELPRKDGKFQFMMTPGDVPAHLIASWPVSVTLPPVVTVDEQVELVTQTQDIQSAVALKLFFELEYPVTTSDSPTQVANKIATPGQRRIGLTGNDLTATLDEVNASITDFVNSTQGTIHIYGFASHEDGSNFSKDLQLSQKRADVLQVLIGRLTNRQITTDAYTHDADAADTNPGQ